MDQATKTREALFAQAASEGYLVASAYLPFPGIGHVNTRVERNGTINGYRWIQVNYSLNGLEIAPNPAKQRSAFAGQSSVFAYR
ncbi:MAG: hypothetical protein ACR5LF_04465 [Symbiopectobacterium sp.]